MNKYAGTPLKNIMLNHKSTKLALTTKLMQLYTLWKHLNYF